MHLHASPVAKGLINEYLLHIGMPNTNKFCVIYFLIHSRSLASSHYLLTFQLIQVIGIILCVIYLADLVKDDNGSPERRWNVIQRCPCQIYSLVLYNGKDDFVCSILYRCMLCYCIPLYALLHLQAVSCVTAVCFVILYSCVSLCALLHCSAVCVVTLYVQLYALLHCTAVCFVTLYSCMRCYIVQMCALLHCTAVCFVTLYSCMLCYIV